jgi:hypothetical protein
LAIRGPDIFRDVRREFGDDDERTRAYALTERVLLDVVGLLRDGLNVPHLRVLPYPSVVPLLAEFVHRFGMPVGRSVVLLRRWFWRGAALGANPAGNPPQVRRSLRAIKAAGSASEAIRALLAELPSLSEGQIWSPDLAQVASNRALTRVNILGLISIEPKELRPEARELPVPAPAIAPGELLDNRHKALLGVVPTTVFDGAVSRSIANRIVHPPVPGGDVVAAVLAASPDVRASHAIDETCTELLARGDWGAALQHRAEVVTDMIKDFVDDRAEWGALDRPTAAELIGRESA